MSSFPKLPHVEAGTNLFVLNALETVVDNNAERVFDFIVAGMVIHVYTIRDGKVLEDAVMTDALAIMQQLGLAPSAMKAAK